MKITRRDFLKMMALSLLLIILLPIIPMGTASEGTTHTVLMTDAMKYEPDILKIQPGDTVVWKNKQGNIVTHTVTAYEKEIPKDAEYFASGNFTNESDARRGIANGLIPTDGEYRHTFTVNGSYKYFCVPHEAAPMIGYIIVAEGATPTDRETPNYLIPITVGTIIGVMGITSLAFYSIQKKKKRGI